MTNGSRWVVLLTGVSLVLGASLKCRRNPPPATTSPGPSPVATRPTLPTPRPAPGHGAQVIVDSSQSLAGFTAARDVARSGRTRWRDSGSTRMSALHEQVIERALAQLNANAPFKRCLLDTELRCGEVPVQALQFNDPQTYRGTDAALDRVLRRPVAHARPDANEQDFLDPFAITVLLTDGFQTVPTPAQGASDVNCAGGADPACLGSLLAARVRDGFGVWIGRVNMPFGGMYYPERPIDEMWPRIEAHVDDLNHNHPEWNGVQFGARHGRRGAPGGSFRWEGARPLLMIVLSRDVALGRNFGQRVGQFMRNEDTIFARGAVGAASSANRDAPDWSLSEFAPFDGATGHIDESLIRRTQSGGAADAVRIAPATRDARGVNVSIRCSLQGVATFPVHASVQRGATHPSFVDVVPSWRVEGAPEPWLTVTPQPGTLDLTASVDCRRLPQGSHTQTLGLYVEWQRNEARIAQEWFWRDSVETSYEAPEKVYRLRELVMPPLMVATDRRGWLDHLRVTITRE